jgi:NADPH-dependent glutamate synthase beta subunit-like oxidoreductase
VTVFEVPTTDIAVIVSTLDDATTPMDLPARELPGVGLARPYMTALDLEKRRLFERGYSVVDTTIVADRDTVVTVLVQGTDVEVDE